MSSLESRGGANIFRLNIRPIWLARLIFRNCERFYNFFDVTLACEEGHLVDVHKVILAGQVLFNWFIIFLWTLSSSKWTLFVNICQIFHVSGVFQSITYGCWWSSQLRIEQILRPSGCFWKLVSPEPGNLGYEQWKQSFSLAQKFRSMTEIGSTSLDLSFSQVIGIHTAASTTNIYRCTEIFSIAVIYQDPGALARQLLFDGPNEPGIPLCFLWHQALAGCEELSGDWFSSTPGSSLRGCLPIFIWDQV